MLDVLPFCRYIWLYTPIISSISLIRSLISHINVRLYIYNYMLYRIFLVTPRRVLVQHCLDSILANAQWPGSAVFGATSASSVEPCCWEPIRYFCNASRVEICSVTCVLFGYQYWVLYIIGVYLVFIFIYIYIYG